jgi:hypothetical protein
MTTTETKIIVDASLPVFMLTFEEAVLDGWVLSGGAENPQVGYYGYLYEATLERKAEAQPVPEAPKKPGRTKTALEPKTDDEAPSVLLS